MFEYRKTTNQKNQKNLHLDYVSRATILKKRLVLVCVQKNLKLKIISSLAKSYKLLCL